MLFRSDADEIYWMVKEEAGNDTKPSPKKDFVHKPSHPNPNPTYRQPFTRPGNPSNSEAKFKNLKEKSKNFLNNKVGKNGKLTTDERERRLKEGLCLYCGEKGHVAHDCPKSKATKACATALASDESRTDSADSKK